MDIDKKQMQDILTGILDELPLRTDELGRISDEETALIRRKILNAIPDILSQVLLDSDDVVCHMPYNVEVISLHQSVRCAGCGRYFCRRHNLSVCPVCAAPL